MVEKEIRDAACGRISNTQEVRLHRKELVMLKLKEMKEFESAKYYGFTLKNGFWYGINTETGNLVATSGWEVNNGLAVYELIDGEWILDWWEIEKYNFSLELPECPDLNGKMSFKDWVEEVEGVDYDYYDNNYGNTDDIEEAYRWYLYELPKFVTIFFE